MAEEFDPFKGSSGLVDDVDLTFTECKFAKDPQYKDSETGEMIPVFEATLVGGDEPARQLFSIGKGWKITNSGGRVERENGPPKGFNSSSYIQTLLDTLLGFDENALRQRWEDTGLAPQDAGFWEGLTCHMVQEPTLKFDGTPSGKTRLMPTDFQGFSGAVKGGGDKEEAKPAPAKKAAAKKAPAKKAAAAKVEEVEETAADATPYATARAAVGDDVVAKIREVADAAEDAEAFVAAAYEEVDGIDDSEDIMFLVDNYADTESIWAEAVAAFEAS